MTRLSDVDKEEIIQVLEKPDSRALDIYLQKHGCEKILRYLKEFPEDARVLAGPLADQWAKLALENKNEIRMLRQINIPWGGIIGGVLVVAIVGAIVGGIVGYTKEQNSLRTQAEGISVGELVKEAERQGCYIRVSLNETNGTNGIESSVVCSKGREVSSYVKDGKSTLLAPVDGGYINSLDNKEKVGLKNKLAETKDAAAGNQ
jgi:hypothetical protein